MNRMRIVINEYGIGFAKIGIIHTIPNQFAEDYFAGKLYEYFDTQFSVVEDRRLPDQNTAFVRMIGNKVIIESPKTPKFEI